MNASEWMQTLSSHERWGPLVAARAPQIVAWVLALALGVQAALILTSLAGAGASPTDTGPRAPASTAPARRIDLAALVNAHLFGVPSAPSAAGSGEAPPTTMSLVLAGVLAQADPEKGYAIVGETAAAAKLYAVGDSIPGGARLHSVYGDRVLIDRGGTIESLPLPRQSTGAPLPTPSAGQAPAVSAENPVFERMRRVFDENPSAVGDIMRPQPVFAQGRQRGYRVYPGRNRAAFVQLGLRPGDLVTAINGTPLDDPARGMEIFRTIGSQPEVRVTISRNGRQQDLVLNMTQAAQAAEQLAGAEGASPAEQAPPVPPETSTSRE